ncbi:MAG: family 43 glycosylhydrolase [Clostridia bacterium]|nr:family 43 glycosylhydrolase [Clostridia bacterium]
MKINEINIRDPFILTHNNTYYMYGSRVGLPEGNLFHGRQNGIDVYISHDLENWVKGNTVFAENESFWGKYQFWAPEVHVYKNKFYMFATFKSDDRCRGTHILSCDIPDGEFKPISENPQTPSDWECLDGTFYVDKSGNPHLVFCHEWAQVGDGEICEVQLSDDLTHAVTEPRILWKASAYKDVISTLPDQKALVTDGPFFHRCKNGSLACIWSTYSAKGYAELVSVSDNGDIDGSWKLIDTPISNCDGGHGMIFTSLEGETLFVMHKPNVPTTERPVIFPVKEIENKLILDE